jgi:hypothetical protein
LLDHAIAEAPPHAKRAPHDQRDVDPGPLEKMRQPAPRRGPSPCSVGPNLMTSLRVKKS